MDLETKFISYLSNNKIDVAKWLCTLCSDYIVNIKYCEIINYSSDLVFTVEKIFELCNNNDIVRLEKIFKIKYDTCDELCIICKENNIKYMLNLKCELNNKTYNHCYCNDCFYQWYMNNTKKCLCCFAEFNLESKTIFLEIKN